VADHSLSHYRVGGRIRFSDVDLDAWLEGRRVDGTVRRAN
jgi:excisionase family DNA binding protein